MALTKCKECGEQVSNKAKTCPKCGAATPKKTSAFTWIIALLFGVIIFTTMQGTDTPSETRSTTASRGSGDQANTPASPRAERTEPAWRTTQSRDEMSGEQSSFAMSPSASSTRPMNFPYRGTTGTLAVGCNSSSEWAYFNFSNAPNLNRTQTREGYNEIRTRIRWNETIEDVTLTQRWGSTTLHFRNAQDAIQKIASANSVMLQLNWHGEDQVNFEISLRGSAAALNEIRSQCANY